MQGKEALASAPWTWLVGLLVLVAGCEPDSGSGDGTPPGGAAAFDVVEATIAQAHQALTDGTISCEWLVDAYLERIERLDAASGVHAITVVNPEARARARELDAALETTQDPAAELGPLFCVPVLVKDNFDTVGLPATGGSVAMLEVRPPDDAFMVRRLKQAGAIVIAKTNMAEWAFSPRRTESSSYGVTANAYDVGYVPAGSSGGTASAVAASFALAGLGTDTGNSIRGPSSHLALFGIRSTLGLTSRDGIIPLAFDRDVAGPMTRTVEDGARLLTVLAGQDPADPLTRAAPEPVDYTGYLVENGLEGLRIGVLERLVETDDADLRVLALFRAALADLERLGATVVDPAPFPELETHLEGDYFCPRFRYDMRNYLASLGPAAPFDDVMTVRQTGQYSEYVADRLDYFAAFPLDVAPDDWSEPCPTWPDHPGRARFLADTVAMMDGLELDLLVYPTWTNPPARIDQPDEGYRGDNSQLIAPATGMPAATVPMGFVDGHLPAGLQLLARPFDEGLIFKAAYAYEQGTHHRRPPVLHVPSSSGDSGR